MLTVKDGIVHFKLLRALGRLHTDNPQIELDRKVLDQATVRTLKMVCRMLDWRLALQQGGRDEPRRATPVQELLITLLENKETHAIERLFRLLDLQHVDERFRDIHRGLESPSPQALASSRELLANLLLPPLRDAVIGMVDDLPDAERLRRARAYHRPFTGSYERLLRDILEQDSTALRSLVAYHIGQLQLEELTPQLEALESQSEGFIQTVLKRTLYLLKNPTLEPMGYIRPT